MRILATLTLTLGLFVAPGCGGGGDGDGRDADIQADADPNAPDADPTLPDGGVPAGFTSLISRSWSIPAGQEVYRCTRVTLEEDMYISTFRALAPLGTHHTVVSVNANPTQADGDYNCSAGSIAHSMLFASGVGTNDLGFPEGVAIRVRAGHQLELNLHLYNVGDSEITGTSGTLVKVIPVAEVQQEAEVVFGGEYYIALQPDDQNLQSVNGGCEFGQDATVLALWPHMHQLGRHIKVVHESGAGDVTLLDTSFDFGEQVNYEIEPVQVSAGERFEIVCSYLNDTGGLVTFGDSSDKEMCFVGIYRYPATGAGTFSCVEIGL